MMRRVLERKVISHQIFLRSQLHILVSTAPTQTRLEIYSFYHFLALWRILTMSSVPRMATGVHDTVPTLYNRQVLSSYSHPACL